MMNGVMMINCVLQKKKSKMMKNCLLVMTLTNVNPKIVNLNLVDQDLKMIPMMMRRNKNESRSKNKRKSKK